MIVNNYWFKHAKYEGIENTVPQNNNTACISPIFDVQWENVVMNIVWLPKFELT